MSKATTSPSYWLVVAGLLTLGIVLPLWLHASVPAWGWPGAVSAAIIPAALLYAVLQRRRNWSGITALTMIPVACIGVMDIVANLREPDSGMALAVLGIGVFFAALDAGRREARTLP